MTVDEAFEDWYTKRCHLSHPSCALRQAFEAGWEYGEQMGYLRGYKEGERDGTSAEADRHEPPDLERV